MMDYDKVAARNRKPETNEQMHKIAAAMRDIADMFDLVANGKTSLAKECRARRYKYSTANTIPKARSEDELCLASINRYYQQVNNLTDFCFPNSILENYDFDGYELLYCDIFGLATVPDNFYFPSDLEDTIWHVLNMLGLREKKVIIMSYGLNGDAMTLKQIGACFNVNAERIRQIKAKALRCMRRHSRIIKYGLKAIAMEKELADKKVREYVNQRLEEMDDILRKDAEIKASSIRMERRINSIMEEESAPEFLLLNRFKLLDLGLDVRAYNCMRRSYSMWEKKLRERMSAEEIKETLRKVDWDALYIYACIESEDMVKIRNLGLHTKEEIQSKLDAFLRENIKMSHHEFLQYVERRGNVYFR